MATCCQGKDDTTYVQLKALIFVGSIENIAT